MTTTTNTPRGPFETGAQAFAAAGGLYLAIDRADPGGRMDDAVRAARTTAKVRYVTETLTAAGVKLGQHDQRIARWIACMWDPETTVVVLDWVLRARAELLAELPVYDSPEAMFRALDDGGAR